MHAVEEARRLVNSIDHASIRGNDQDAEMNEIRGGDYISASNSDNKDATRPPNAVLRAL